MTFRTIRNIGLGIMIAILVAVGLVPTLTTVNISAHDAHLYQNLKQLNEVIRLNERFRNTSFFFDQIIRNSETDFSSVISSIEKIIETSRRLEKMLKGGISEDENELEEVQELIRNLQGFKVAVQNYGMESVNNPALNHALQLQRVVLAIQRKISETSINFLYDTNTDLDVNLTNMKRIIRTSQKVSLAGLAVGVTAGFIVAFLMGHFLSKPIERLVKGTERVSAGDLDFKIESKGSDEFSRLAKSFNWMTERLKAFVERENEIKQELEEQVALRSRELEISEKQRQQLNLQQEIQKSYSELVSLLNSIDISLILEQSLNRIVESAGMQWGGFYLCNGKERTLSLKKSFFLECENSCPSAREKALQQKAQELALQVFQGQNIVMSEWMLPGQSDDNFSVTAKGYPLKFQEKHLGVMVLIGDSEFDPYTDAFVENSAKQLGVAIHNALTFQDFRHKSSELKQSNWALKRASQAKSDFLANMSHELRTPLNHIIGFTELVVDKNFGELNEVQEEYLNDALSSAKHLLSLINDILDLSKVEAGKMELHPSSVNIKELLAVGLLMVKEKAMKHGIQLSADDDDVPETIEADERKLKQVMFNLLSNAVKFIPEGGTIDVGAEVIDRQWLQNNVPALFRNELRPVMENHCPSYLKVSVADNGIGIKPQSLTKIFGEFQQEEISTSKNYGGTGLGLALCKKLLDLHKGGIWVESQINVGSTFSFVIPLTRKYDGCQAEPMDTLPVARPGFRPDKPLILVVDDDEKMCRRMLDLFNREGYCVQTAMDGQTAITRAGEALPNLILLDLMLPKTDGWEVLTRLKADKKTKDIPIIICSAIEDRKITHSLGACDYLIKPVQREDLLACLKKNDLYPCNERKNKDILLVDNAPKDRKYYADILRREGFAVRPAESGSEAIFLAGEEPPALILLDLLMPGMSGYQVLDTLKKDTSNRDIPVVILTGKSLSRAEREKLASDIEGVVRKSHDNRGLLLSEVKKVLAV